MRERLFLILLFVACFCLALSLESRQLDREGETRSGGVLGALLGDSRRIFSKHFFFKAEEYFRKGNVESLIDEQGQPQPSAVPLNWIERFGTHFRPTHYAALGATNEVREMLPWLYLSVEVDPHNIPAYLAGAHYLRRSLKNVAEAEKFLRAGLVENPRSYEILLELGNLYYEDARQPDRAGNVWELALQRWREAEAGEAEPDVLASEQITIRLARLEEDRGHYEDAIRWLEMAKQSSRSPEALQKQIDALRAQLSSQSKPH